MRTTWNRPILPPNILQGLVYILGLVVTQCMSGKNLRGISQVAAFQAKHDLMRSTQCVVAIANASGVSQLCP